MRNEPLIELPNTVSLDALGISGGRPWRLNSTMTGLASNAYPDRPCKNNYFFERTGGSSGTNPFGTWSMNYNKALALSQHTVTYEPDDKDGVRCSTSSSGQCGPDSSTARSIRSPRSIARGLLLRCAALRTFELTGRRANTGPEIWLITQPILPTGCRRYRHSKSLLLTPNKRLCGRAGTGLRVRLVAARGRGRYHTRCA